MAPKPLTPAIRFVARLYCIGIIRHVDVPAKAGARFSGTRVPVRGSCNGVSLTGTLMPRGQGNYRLAVSSLVRKTAGGVDVGDTVVITLRQSPPRPVPTMPGDLSTALASHRGGRAAFEAWPPGKRREVFQWVAAARRPETRARRIARVLEVLGLTGRSGA